MIPKFLKITDRLLQLSSANTKLSINKIEIREFPQTQLSFFANSIQFGFLAIGSRAMGSQCRLNLGLELVCIVHLGRYTVFSQHAIERLAFLFIRSQLYIFPLTIMSINKGKSQLSSPGLRLYLHTFYIHYSIVKPYSRVEKPYS